MPSLIGLHLRAIRNQNSTSSNEYSEGELSQYFPCYQNVHNVYERFTPTTANKDRHSGHRGSALSVHQYSARSECTNDYDAVARPRVADDRVSPNPTELTRSSLPLDPAKGWQFALHGLALKGNDATTPRQKTLEQGWSVHRSPLLRT